MSYELATKRTQLPQGDGHTVLFLPGFLAGNSSTRLMRELIGSAGFKAERWAHGINRGITYEVVEATRNQVARLAFQSGGKISIVGQSLGGTLARIVANEVPDFVRCIVTLGSPINGVSGIVQTAKELYDLHSLTSLGDSWESFYQQVVNNPPVPSTSIYSKNDGVVDWGESLQIETDRADNVEVYASHVSMGFDMRTIKVIADRLAQPAGGWKKYVHSELR
jgi:pimeloyl-ACP methyl ester carboxylesterase